MISENQFVWVSIPELAGMETFFFAQWIRIFQGKKNVRQKNSLRFFSPSKNIFFKCFRIFRIFGGGWGDWRGRLPVVLQDMPDRLLHFEILSIHIQQPAGKKKSTPPVLRSINIELHTEIYRKCVVTIQIWIRLTELRKDLSGCIMPQINLIFYGNYDIHSCIVSCV